jgi:hypothetical protein
MKAVTEDSRTISFYDNDQFLCKLVYPGRNSSRAGISMTTGEVYDIVPVNFWKSLFEVRTQGKSVVSLKKKWTGRSVLTSHFNGLSNEYIFRQRGLFNIRYVIMDKDERELAVARSKFIWKGLKYNFEIEVSDSLKRREGHFLLIVLMIYLARSAMRQHSSAAMASA